MAVSDSNASLQKNDEMVQEIEELRELLKNLNSPEKPIPARWLEGPLTKKVQLENPALLPRAAFRQALTYALHALELEAPLDAKALELQYWQDNRIREIIQSDGPLHVSESQFHVIRNRAIERLYVLFREQEELAAKELAKDATALKRAPEPLTPIVQGTPGVTEQSIPNTDSEFNSARLMNETRAITSAPLAARIEQDVGNAILSKRFLRQMPWLILAGAGMIFICVVLLWSNLTSIFSRAMSNLYVSAAPTLTIAETTTPVTLPNGASSIFAQASATAKPVSNSAASNPTPEVAQAVSLCGETSAIPLVVTDRFLRDEGVSDFTKENTAGGVLSDKLRVVVGDETGVWVGAHATETNPVGGLEHYDRVKRGWVHCAMESVKGSRNINDIVIDRAGNVWAALEEVGIALFEKNATEPRLFTRDDHLPDNYIFGLTIDPEGRVWAATGEGVVRYDGKKWDVIYSVANGALQSNDVHAIAFSKNEIWVGSLFRGVSRYRKADGKWVHYDTQNSALAGNEIRRIFVRPAEGNRPEEIWFATEDGGIAVFSNEEWRKIGTADGLPNEHVRWITRDPYGRMWAATTGGVAYLEDGTWKLYHDLASFSVAFSPDKVNPISPDYPDQDYHVWTATVSNGLTHSRIPPRESAAKALDFVGMKFFDENGNELPQPLIVTPEQKFRVEVTVTPRYPYRLKEGDMLVNIDRDEANRFGVHTHFAVRENAESGQPYTFAEYDEFFVAPQLASGDTEETFTSHWQMWLHTRRVGPTIPITFTVRRVSPTPNP